MSKRVLDPAVVADQYRSGMTTTQIARDHGTGTSTVNACLHRNYVRVQRKPKAGKQRTIGLREFVQMMQSRT